MTFSLNLTPNPGAYFLNLENIKNASRFPSFIRLLAARLIDNPTMSLEYFFTQFLSEEDFQILNNICNTLHEKLRDSDIVDNGEPIKEYEILLMLTMLLGRAESSIHEISTDPTEGQAQIVDAVNILMVIIPCVSLHKKGLVRMHWENVTLDADDSKPFVSKLF